MIRRWSRINNLNLAESVKYINVFSVYFDESTRAGLYSRQPYTVLTVFRRKSTARRKHINQWTLYTPILASWANEYLKIRQYLKYTLNSNLFKFNYLMMNMFRLGGLLKNSKLFLWSTCSGYLSRKWLHYFLKYGNSAYQYLKFFKNMSFLFISSPTNLQVSTKRVRNLGQPFYTISSTELVPVSTQIPDNTQITDSLYDSLFDVSRAHFLEIYKLFILLTINNLSK